MPCCHVHLQGQKRSPLGYPRELRTIGDHLRKRRLDLGLLQREVAARFVYGVPILIERFLVFPMAVVPNAWGLWKIVYLALHSRRRPPIGLYGAALPGFGMPLGLVFATALEIEIPVFMLMRLIVSVSAASDRGVGNGGKGTKGNDCHDPSANWLPKAADA